MNAQFKQAVEAFRNGDLDLARDLAEAEVSTAPSPNAHHLLGLIQCRLGDPASGVEHLTCAAEGEPDNVGFKIMLVRALVDAGGAADVLQMPEPPPIRSAGALELWKARAEAADAAPDPDAAIIAWSKVTSAAPNDWRAWANLANAFTMALRWPEAIEAFGNAIRLHPDESSLLWSLGAALAASDRNEEALAMLDAFEQSAGRTGDSALARGRNLVALARFAEAEEAFREALNLSPTNKDAFRNLGLMLERTNQIDSLGALLGKAETGEIAAEGLTYLRAIYAFRKGRTNESYALIQSDPDDEPVRWNRLKARIADRLDKPEEAFAAADAMNRAAPDFEEWRERGADYRARLRKLARTLTSATKLSQLPKPERRPPAFLVGFPRSGTTLLDTFLMGHPDTAVLEEVHLLGAAERQIGRVSDLPQASQEALESARNAYFAELDQHIASGFSGLVVDKLPLNLLGGPFIQCLFPGAPIIFAQRHPCDAVLSGFMQCFVMNDPMASFLTIEDSADLYDAVMSGWQLLREVFPLNVHTVRYERLVDDPESELRPLSDFLGLPWDERMLAHTETAKKRGAISTPSYDQVTEPLSSRSVGRWRRYEKELGPV
ncbi:MAG TPA: sulfotransferase, partial [Sphingomicrobium sp.]|nr:sulfotransferase [Sphingomicrobium sp.]